MKDNREYIAGLKRSEERIRAFIKNNAEAIWCLEFEQPISIDLPEEAQIDLLYKYAYYKEANDASARLTGFEQGEDMVGLRLDDFMPRSMPESIVSLKQVIRARYNLIDLETAEIYKGNEKRIFLNNIVGDIESGQVQRIWGTSRDITSQRAAEAKLREAELRYRTVADFTYDWEYWANMDGTLKYVSPSCERISGYSVQDFIDNPSLFREIIVPQDREIWDRHYRDSRQELKPREIQFRIHRLDGQVRWIEHACQHVSDSNDHSIGFRASNRDITDRKQGEIELQSDYTEIEQLKNQLEAESAYLQDEIKLDTISKISSVRVKH